MPDGISQEKVPIALLAAFLMEVPGWTRLEPQSVSGDPTPGLEARIHDPLWLLTRQWQLGEFEGEDAGTPVSVEVSGASGRVTAWQPGDPGAGSATQPWDGAQPLDPSVEREPTPERGPGLRARIEGGSQFAAMLGDAGLGALIDRTLDHCAVRRNRDPGGPDDPFDRPAEQRLRKLFAGRVADAERLAGEIKQGPPPRPPGWMSAGLTDAGPLNDVVEAWWEWYRGQVAPPDDPASDSWVDERLEYRFRLGLARADGQAVLDAPAFGGGQVDWHTFDAASEGTALEPAGGGAGTPLESRTQTLLAAPLTFAGMPADRYWEFEDGQVNLAALDVQPHDLARLALVEFAVVYGNDWLVVPFDVPAGSLTSIAEVSYTTTFGERFTVDAADPGPAGRRFRLFAISRAGAEETIPGLLHPPTAPARLDGDPLEEVLFGRDEMANMAWGVERRVQGPSGRRRERGDEPGPPPLPERDDPPAELDYLLQTDVPGRWIPLVPFASANWSVQLRKGAMLDREERPIQPYGVLLRPGEPLVLYDEEVPREGVRVQRVPALCRDPEGRYERWISRRVRVGRGESSSALAFDSAILRR